MAYKKRSERKRAAGGKAEGPEYDYNAKGSPEEREEKAKGDGFKRGGKVKREERKHGGHVEGEKAHHSLAKRARGGGVRGMSGGEPFSSARRVNGPDSKKGSPGEQAPMED